jgi:iron complex transport system substrate-binding protein
MKLLLISVCALIVLVTLSCQPSVDQRQTAKARERSTVVLNYAKGFTISIDSPYTWIDVNNPYQGANSGFRYLLVPKGMKVPEHTNDVRVIRTPVSSIACTSTTHIPLLDYLNETDKLAGFTTTDYISSVKARQRIDAGKVTELGVDQGINIEVLAALRPELLMGYTMTAEYGQYRKIEELGIPVVINAEYLETHPLGRAEWIKFMAAFFDKEALADSVFSSIEREYLDTKSRVLSQDVHPSVLNGIIYGDAWFLPGGKNYAATILQDAGYHYLWADDPSSGFLELSFEAVFAKAHNCEYWIGVGPFQSLAELSAGDQRYSQFAAFKNKNVFSYDSRKGAKGGNEYLELGYLRPDLILKDLVKISHPDLLPDHELYFHRRLN